MARLAPSGAKASAAARARKAITAAQPPSLAGIPPKKAGPKQVVQAELATIRLTFDHTTKCRPGRGDDQNPKSHTERDLQNPILALLNRRRFSCGRGQNRRAGCRSRHRPKERRHNRRLRTRPRSRASGATASCACWRQYHLCAGETLSICSDPASEAICSSSERISVDTDASVLLHSNTLPPWPRARQDQEDPVSGQTSLREELTEKTSGMQRIRRLQRSRKSSIQS